MEAVAYRKAEVKQVVDRSLRLLAQRPGGDDPNDHRLQALIPIGTPPVPLSGERPLVATATTTPARAGEVLAVTPLVAGVFPGRSDQLGATFELTLTPEPAGGDRLRGRLDARFEPPLARMPTAAFAFQLDGDRALPIAPAAVVPCGAPEGAGDVFRCIAGHAANALLPALTAGVTGLAAGPQGFLAAAGVAAAAQLPRVVTGAIGCMSQAPGGGGGAARLDVLGYPLAEALRLLEGEAPLEPLLADGARPLDDERWDDLVCVRDDALYRSTGLLAQTPAGATTARGRIEGAAATVPAEWHWTIEVAEPLVTVTVESIDAPRFTHGFVIRDDGTPVPAPPASGGAGGFELACLVASAGGPLLRLTARCLPRLRDGVTPFLRAMLDGAGEALGSAVTQVVRRCVAAPARRPADAESPTDEGR